jgi:hypothetical protein
VVMMTQGESLVVIGPDDMSHVTYTYMYLHMSL